MSTSSESDICRLFLNCLSNLTLHHFWPFPIFYTITVQTFSLPFYLFPFLHPQPPLLLWEFLLQLKWDFLSVAFLNPQVTQIAPLSVFPQDCIQTCHSLYHTTRGPVREIHALVDSLALPAEASLPFSGQPCPLFKLPDEFLVEGTIFILCFYYID